MKIEEYGLGQLTEPLLKWFVGHARVLPWREEVSPYRVWVSEIMLQQTRVEAVKPYFERFIQALPSVEALAECEEERLLKLWEGLGYYNRVRNMQAAAKQVMEEYSGQIPSEYSQLLKLKGIGHYTAGAIASIAFGRAVSAVDGNVLRVISRAAGDDRDIMKQQVRVNMEVELDKIIPKGKAGAFNQALMELGATVCLPNGKPKCKECPWKGLCIAQREGLVELLPVKSKPARRRVEERTVLLIRDGERILIRKRLEKGLLAGMYEFPNELGYMDTKSVVSYVKGQGLLPLRVEEICDAKHIFSHVEWRMKGYLVRIGPVWEAEKGLLFAEVSDFGENYPMPSAFAAYMKYLEIPFGAEVKK